MGQKVNPIGFRLAVKKNWSSKWFSTSKNFASLLNNDIKVREFLNKKLINAAVSKIVIERPAKNAKIKGFNIAGKTGTTQKLINGKYSHKHHVGSFVGYFPAEDPEIVITVVVDEAKMKRGLLGYGGTVAAPAFKNVAEKIISYLGITPTVNSNLVGFNQKIVRETF